MGKVMRNCSRRNGSRFGLRLAIATAAAALLTGCADATRFDDPLANPFKSASNYNGRGARRVDRNPTASIPVREASAKTVRSDAAPAPTASVNNWSPDGGTPVTVGQGETAAVLGTRYGVPTEALLRTNNLSGSGQLTPGSKIIIPVYRPGAGRVSANASKPTKDENASKKPELKKADVKSTKTAAKTIKPLETKTAAKNPDADKAKVEAAKAKTLAAKEQKIKEAKLKKEKEKEKEHMALLAKKKDLAKADKAEKIKVAEAKHSDKKQQVAVNTKTESPKTEPKHEVDPTPTASLQSAEDAKTALDSNPEFRWPARGRVIQSYKAGSNNGINIAVPEGTPVKAAENGVVAYAGSELKNYGNLVLVRHDNGYVSAYAHNASLDVKKGDSVRRGQVIARAGQTGSVTSPQVHFELRKGSKPVDPSDLLASN